MHGFTINSASKKQQQPSACIVIENRGVVNFAALWALAFAAFMLLILQGCGGSNDDASNGPEIPDPGDCPSGQLWDDLSESCIEDPGQMDPGDLPNPDGDDDFSPDGDEVVPIDGDEPIIDGDDFETPIVDGDEPVDITPERDPRDQLCDGIYCSGSGRCIAIDMQPRCLCLPGYHEEGLSCIPNDLQSPCEGVDCGSGGQCVVETDGLGEERIACNCPQNMFDLNLHCLPIQDPGGCEMRDIGNDVEVCLPQGNPMGNMNEYYFPNLASAISDNGELPDKVDHRSEYLNDYLSQIDDQGQCGTCVAFASTHSLESSIASRSVVNTDLSQSHVWKMAGLSLSCTNGTSIPRVVSAITGSMSVVPDDIWTYDCNGYGGNNSCYGWLVEAPSSMNADTDGLVRGLSPYSVYAYNTYAIEKALASGHNVIYGVPVYGSTWYKWGKPILIDVPTNGAAFQGGHAILIVGYDRGTREFTFLNSWSEYWGDGGYGKFTYDFIQYYGYGGMVIPDVVARTCESDSDCSCGVCQEQSCVSVEEVFNGRDDNCDGRIDEGFDCALGEERACGGTDVGECQAGVQSCENGRWSDCVGDLIGPAPELCDNKDNDCDGQTDEDLQVSCGSDEGACKQGVSICSAGQWSGCLGQVVPSEETCDLLDNDCDGQTDEDIAFSDIPAEALCPTLGICANGGAVNRCVEGNWICDFPENYEENECAVENEHCGGGSFSDPGCADGLDTDCDGEQDEHSVTYLCEMLPDYWKVEQSQECYQKPFGRCLQQSGVYACDQSVVSCAVRVACIGGTMPTAEQCDDQDWDCDGITYDRNDLDDDGFGDCPGYVDCDDTRAESHPGAVEICDGHDNNCDGRTDEDGVCDGVDGDIDGDVDGDVEPDDPDLIWMPIPSGTFQMGCSVGDTQCYEAGTEEPRHEVSVPAFEMTRTEITRDQFVRVMGFDPTLSEDCPDCPVENISFENAEDFCEAVGGRLPSEAEWEYAARGGVSTKYYCGETLSCLDEIAWLSGPAHEVGEKQANNFGLHEMLGNVWEWVADCSHPNYTDAPTDGSVWEGGNCSLRVLRGGCWICSTQTMRASARAAGSVGELYDFGVGIRCARDVEIVDGDEPAVDGDEPVVDGDEPVVDGDEPVVDGDEPVVDGDEPVVDGDEPVVDGDDPVVDGDEPVVDGDEPVVDGDEPVVDGDEPVVDGDEPVVDGDEPVVDGDEPVVDGDEPVVDGDEPIVDGDEPVVDGDEPLVDGDEPVVDGDEPVVDGDEPVVDGDEPVVDGDEPVVDGDEPVVDGDEPVVDGDEPVVDGDEPVVDGDEPVVDGDEDETDVHFAYVCAGSFDMGCSQDDDLCTEYETGGTTTFNQDFFVTPTEITQAQFEAVMGFNPSYFSNCPTCPVEQVTWQEANDFCAQVDARLPSSAEWEYAARATTLSRYICGPNESCLADIAWYDANSNTGYDRHRTHPVAQLDSNLWGLYDMLGNVWEWVSDCAPTSAGCEYRLMRGGSWFEESPELRVSNLGWNFPENRFTNVGFRCVQDLY